MLFAGFLLSVFLDYVRPGAYLPALNSLHVNSIVPVSVFVFSLFHKGDVADSTLFRCKNSRWLLIFVVLMVVSVFFADVTLYSFEILKTVFGFMLWFYVCVKLVTTKERLLALFRTFVLSHVLLLILNPALVLNPSVRSYLYGNPFLGDGNDFALSVAFVVPLCLYLFREAQSSWIRILWGAALCALSLGVVGTQSRGGTLALASVFLYLWWRGRKKAVGLVLIGAAVAAVLAFAPSVYFERLDTIANYQANGSAMGRITAWKAAVRMAIEHPVLGVGTGHFPVKFGTEFRPQEWGDSPMPWLTAHSMYFLLLGELGIPGITFLLVMLIGNFSINERLISEARVTRTGLEGLFLTMNASLVGFAVAGAFLSVAYYPHLYVLSGIWTAAQLLQQRLLVRPE